MIVFRHRSGTVFPMISDLPKQISGVMSQVFEILKRTFTNIYDDLRMLEKVESVSSLPTAGSDYHRKLVILANAGGEDTLHICVKNNSTGAYSWKAVTLS